MNVLLVSYTIYFKGRLFGCFDFIASGVPPGRDSNDKKNHCFKYMLYKTEFVWTLRSKVLVAF